MVPLAKAEASRTGRLLQSLCQPHHDAKTRRGRKAREDSSAMTLRFKTTYCSRHYGQKLGGHVPRLWPTTARAHQAQVLPVLTPNRYGSLPPLPLLTLPLNSRTMPRMLTMSWVAAKPIVPMKMM